LAWFSMRLAATDISPGGETRFGAICLLLYPLQ
jgi:hypothetical protein